MGDRNQPESAPASFEALDAWKVARELTAEIYALCQREPLCRDYGLCDQLRPSRGEVRSMSYVLLDNHFISAEQQADPLTH